MPNLSPINHYYGRTRKLCFNQRCEYCHHPWRHAWYLKQGRRSDHTPVSCNNYTVVTERVTWCVLTAPMLMHWAKSNMNCILWYQKPALKQLKKLLEVMKTVYDPEIPVNIVDLGLVYYCNVKPVGEGKNDVHIIMTLTAPGCGMGPVIQMMWKNVSAHCRRRQCKCWSGSWSALVEGNDVWSRAIAVGLY